MSPKVMILLASVGIASVGEAQQASVAGGVCARLATQTGMKTQRDGSWRANMLGGVGAALFGGTTGASFLVGPIEGSTADQRFDKACAQVGAEIACTVVGPARITVGTKSGNASADVAAGETAHVGMKGRYLTCREGR
jgi:hypothetical protein